MEFSYFRFSPADFHKQAKWPSQARRNYAASQFFNQPFQLVQALVHSCFDHHKSSISSASLLPFSSFHIQAHTIAWVEYK